SRPRIGARDRDQCDGGAPTASGDLLISENTDLADLRAAYAQADAPAAPKVRLSAMSPWTKEMLDYWAARRAHAARLQDEGYSLPVLAERLGAANRGSCR